MKYQRSNLMLITDSSLEPMVMDTDLRQLIFLFRSARSIFTLNGHKTYKGDTFVFDKTFVFRCIYSMLENLLTWNLTRLERRSDEWLIGWT